MLLKNPITEISRLVYLKIKKLILTPIIERYAECTLTASG